LLAELQAYISKRIRYQEIPIFAELFEAGRREGKSDEELEDIIRKIEEQSDKNIIESIKDEDLKPYAQEIVDGWKAIREEHVVKAAKEFADRIVVVEKEFKKFAKLEKESKDLTKDIGFRHDRWIMTFEDSDSYEDIKEQGLIHTFKDKRNLLYDAYVTTENPAYVRVFDIQENTKLPDISKYVAGRVNYYYTTKTDDNIQQRNDKLIDAAADHKTEHYRNLGRYVLESEDDETDRIVGLKDKPDNPSILDYQVLYESPKCIEKKEEYSSGEWLIAKKPIEP
jgi:hypothetical protein